MIQGIIYSPPFDLGRAWNTPEFFGAQRVRVWTDWQEVKMPVAAGVPLQKLKGAIRELENWRLRQIISLP